MGSEYDLLCGGGFSVDVFRLHCSRASIYKTKLMMDAALKGKIVKLDHEAGVS